MDGCSLSAFVPTADQVTTALAIAGTVVTAASAVCATLPAPAPGTRASRLYRVIEIAALLVGNAKRTGALPAGKTKALDDAIELVRKERP